VCPSILFDPDDPRYETEDATRSAAASTRDTPRRRPPRLEIVLSRPDGPFAEQPPFIACERCSTANSALLRTLDLCGWCANVVAEQQPLSVRRPELIVGLRPSNRPSSRHACAPPAVLATPAARTDPRNVGSLDRDAVRPLDSARQPVLHVRAQSRVTASVAALRRSSRELVDGDRPMRRAISRIQQPPTRTRAICSRSANDK